MAEQPHGNLLQRAASGARRWLGIEVSPVGHIERLVSLIGGFIAIYSLIAIERTFIGETGAALLIASMGASAVLLFAVPHGALSQPWAVIVGHTVSAVIGVTAARIKPDQTTASAAAVGLSIGAMHYLRAIHPPGGATALTAVVAGPDIQALGYGFVLAPVLINATIMVGLAVAINAAFSWRRYPAWFGKEKRLAAATGSDAERITHADFVSALRRMGTFIDIDEEDFLRLEALSREAANARGLTADAIRLGAYYSNDGTGPDWCIRRIIDENRGKDGDIVIWKTVAGKDRNTTGLSSREEFAKWAAYEVAPSESAWIRRSDGTAPN